MSGVEQLLSQLVTQSGQVMQELGKVQGQNAEILRRQDKADASRVVIHQRLGAVEIAVSAAASAANSAKDACAELQPIVAELEIKRQRRIGRLELLKCLTVPRIQAFVIGAGSAALAWMTAVLSPIGAMLPDWLARLLLIRA